MYANWGTRVGAYLIDMLAILPLYLIAWILDRPQADPITGETSGGGAIYWILVLAAVAVSGYNRWFQAGRTGRSWGKQALGVSLVDVNTDRPIGAGRAFLRDVAHIVDTVICYIGWLFPLWDAQRQTLADKIVKSVVAKG